MPQMVLFDTLSAGNCLRGVALALRNPITGIAGGCARRERPCSRTAEKLSIVSVLSISKSTLFHLMGQTFPPAFFVIGEVVPWTVHEVSLFGIPSALGSAQKRRWEFPKP